MRTGIRSWVLRLRGAAIARWRWRARAALAAGAAAGRRRIHIAFVGDSMADGLWGAMFRRLGKDKCLAEKVKLIREAKNGTGLTRLDQFNWIDEVGAIADDPGAGPVRRLVRHQRSPADRRAGQDAHRLSAAPRSTRATRPSSRTSIQRAIAKDDSILIVGLPVMLDADANADARPRTSCSPRRVKAVGSPRATYAQPWTSQPAPDEYKPFLPNARNTMVQVRATDGIHFTTSAMIW